MVSRQECSKTSFVYLFLFPVILSFLSACNNNFTVPTATFYPTYTMYPTYTAQSPIEIVVTPTSPIKFGNIAEFKGNQVMTTEYMDFGSGIVKITWDYVGDTGFELYVDSLNSQHKELIVSTTETTNGEKLLEVSNLERYALDIVRGDGIWAIRVAILMQ